MRFVSLVGATRRLLCISILVDIGMVLVSSLKDVYMLDIPSL